MGDTLLKKSLAIGIIFFFVISCVPYSTLSNEISTSTFGGNILYVGGSGPGNYSIIQDAINDANDGDTVYVYDDSSPYFESIIILESIYLVGENKHTTVIDGGKNRDVILVFSDMTQITGFTIRNSGWGYAGISIRSNDVMIQQTIILNNTNGIYLNCSQNTSIYGNDIFYNYLGLDIDACFATSISQNNISANIDGALDLLSSNNNTISQNIISANTFGGIQLTSSNNNLIINNHLISNNLIDSTWLNGLSLVYSNNNKIENNSFLKDGFFIRYSYHNIVINNTVNGKPLVYLENEQNISITGEISAGQIILVNCYGINITKQEITNTNVAIELWQTNHCLISTNTIESNYDNAVMLFYSHRNHISNNTIRNTQYYNGIYLHSSDTNYISGNIITHNGPDLLGNGIHLFNSSNNVVSDNIVKSNSWNGVYFGVSHLNTIINNSITSNDVSGIYFDFSDGNTISDNLISGSRYGIRVGHSSYEIIPGNTVISDNTITNNQYGIYTIFSGENLISNNTITDNRRGIIFLNAPSNVITNNNFMRNSLCDATFRYSYDDNRWPSANHWSNNYWSQPRTFPKPIFGLRFQIPWLNFDWNPRIIPYG